MPSLQADSEGKFELSALGTLTLAAESQATERKHRHQTGKLKGMGDRERRPKIIAKESD
jgi:hypothetical protein